MVAFCSDRAPQGYPFPVRAIPPGLLPLRYLKAFFAVLKAAGRADLVYVNEHLALLHVLAAKLRGKPVAIRIMVDGAWEIAHRKGWCADDDINVFQTKRYGWKVRLARSLQRRWWKWATHIIACSEFLRQILVRNYGVPGEKVQRIFNAYHGPAPDSLRETRAGARARLGLSPGKRYVLTICRLMVWKRVDGIIDALAGLPGDVELLVAGDGDMEAAWKQHASEKGLAQRVHFLGNVPHAQIPLYLLAADVFVLNSRYEGLSHTLVEAQAFGTPIVASNVCGNPEVVVQDESGQLVDPFDTDALRRAIARYLEDPEFARRMAAGGLRGRARFDHAATFGEVEQALRHASGCT